MRKIVLGLIVLVAFASCQEQQKIAFIDNGQVINDYQMKLDVEEQFKVKDDVFKKRMDSIGKAFQIEAQAFQMAAQNLSKKKQQEKYQELGQKQQSLQQQFQYEQQIMQQEFNVEMDSIISKVNTFVEDYGEKNGYTFILGKNGAGSVLYGSEAKDITEAVTKAINADFNKAGTEVKKEETGKNTLEEKSKEEGSEK
jgi:outer membrane protein